MTKVEPTDRSDTVILLWFLSLTILCVAGVMLSAVQRTRIDSEPPDDFPILIIDYTKTPNTSVAKIIKYYELRGLLSSNDKLSLVVPNGQEARLNRQVSSASSSRALGSKRDGFEILKQVDGKQWLRVEREGSFHGEQKTVTSWYIVERNQIKPLYMKTTVDPIILFLLRLPLIVLANFAIWYIGRIITRTYKCCRNSL